MVEFVYVIYLNRIMQFDSIYLLIPSKTDIYSARQQDTDVAKQRSENRDSLVVASTSSSHHATSNSILEIATSSELIRSTYVVVFFQIVIIIMHLLRKQLAVAVPVCFVIGASIELFMIKTGFYNIVTRVESERRAEKALRDKEILMRMKELNIKVEGVDLKEP